MLPSMALHPIFIGPVFLGRVAMQNPRRDRPAGIFFERGAKDLALVVFATKNESCLGKMAIPEGFSMLNTASYRTV